MTRKHFKAIADKIAQANYLKLSQKRILAKDIADALQEFNPNFDEQRFANACLGEK